MRWSRVLSARNNELRDNLLSLIGRLSPSLAGEDRWHWKHSSNDLYEVAKAYTILLKQQAASPVIPLEESLAFRRLWKGWAIRKANITAWKILKGRLATADNLSKRGVPLHSQSCCLCSSAMESISHLLYTCPISSTIWYNIFSWLGVVLVPHSSPIGHFLQVSDLFEKRKLRATAIAIWVCTSWSIWCLRNDLIFNQGQLNLDRFITSIKIRIWNWISCRDPGFKNFKINAWLGDPRCILDKL